jgi:hypothetical protein
VTELRAESVAIIPMPGPADVQCGICDLYTYQYKHTLEIVDGTGTYRDGLLTNSDFQVAVDS